MKRVLISLVSIAALMLTVACDDDVRLADEGEGRLVLSPEIMGDVKVVSRAIADEDQLRESLILWISNNKGPVRKYVGEANVPAEEWLVAGKYVAEAWAGDSVSASFDKRWFKGSAEFEIRGGETSNVTVPCKIANVLVEVNYADDIAETFADFTMSVGHKRGKVIFEGADTRTAYFMMPSYDKNLAWTLTATTKNGDLIQRSGAIVDAKPATKYVLNVHYNAASDEIGGSYMDVVVDQTEEEVYDDIVIELPPVIQGMGFDPTQELVAKAGEVGRRSLFISASAGMKSAKISLDGFSSLLGIKDVNGNDFNDFDFVNAEEAFLESVRQVGINSIYAYESAEDVSTLKINFEEEFTSRLSDGLYAFTLEVVDAKDRVSTLVMNIRVSNAPLRIEEVNINEVWAKNATITATALREEYGNVSFEYHKAGDSSWLTAVAKSNGSNLSAELTSLEPATTYEYRVVTDVEGFVSDVKTFVTEAALQLPNASFEDWYLIQNKLWVLGKEGSDKYWDSGNSALQQYMFIVKKENNPTSLDETVKHSGTGSVRLKSINVAGVQFAAGNMFIGEFIRTDGTNGVIGWGRQWNVRPKKLTGWAKYDPKSITKENSDYSELKKGDMDKGIIYIALLDNSSMSSDSGKDYPVIIKTKATERQLFDKDAPNVIAYGELVFDQATAGDGLVQFEVELKYNRNDVKPSYIMCTASSSKGGDYYVGGEGSTLWLDDLELVY